MSLEDFKKLLPYLRNVETVVLEGWGESLLHKDLAECVQLIKKEGSKTGFVTSGKGLAKGLVSELIEAGLDFVGFSIAGTRPETHAAIRVNSHLAEILSSAQSFNEEKARQGVVRPKIHLVFLMLKDNIVEVPAVPSLAEEMGIEEVVLTNLCHGINPWQERQRVFVWDPGRNEYEEILKEAEANARKLKIRLRRPSLSAIDVPVCEEDPLSNLYISVEGEVSPCVYLYPPLPSPFKRIFCGEEHWLDRVSFGNIFREPFPSIWKSGGYVNFRDCFIRRKSRFKELCLSLWEVRRAGDSEEAVLPGPPDPCKTCHKIIGI